MCLAVHWCPFTSMTQRLHSPLRKFINCLESAIHERFVSDLTWYPEYHVASTHPNYSSFWPLVAVCLLSPPTFVPMPLQTLRNTASLNGDLPLAYRYHIISYVPCHGVICCSFVVVSNIRYIPLSHPNIFSQHVQKAWVSKQAAKRTSQYHMYSLSRILLPPALCL